MSKQLTIKVTDKQYDLLRRIAIDDNRKLNDFIRLIFATGLDFHWCEDSFSIEKKDDEYTSQEQDQIVKNSEIEKKLQKKGQNLYELEYEEQKKLGYKPVCDWHRGGGYRDDEPDLADALAKQIREPLQEKV